MGLLFMKSKNIIVILVMLSFIFISCDGSGSGNQYDQNGYFNDTSDNYIAANDAFAGGAPSGGGNNGNNNNDNDDNNDNSLKDICGAITNKSYKIINGVSCPAANSPVMQILIYHGLGYGICSGTLIDSNVILTAGHCFKEIPAGETIKEVVVMSGNNKLKVSNYYVQDDYDPRYGLDIAVVILKKQVANIAPVPVVTSVTPKANASIMTYGYGVTETGNAGSLKAAYMKILETNSPFIRAAYDTTKTNVCSGDSGGPAVIKVNGVAGVVAITSFGTVDSCLTGDITSFPLLSYSKNLKFIKKYATISTL